MKAFFHVNIDPLVLEALLLGTVGVVAVVLIVIVARELRGPALTVPPETQLHIFPVRVEPLSMTVTANDRMNDYLHLRFTVSDPNVTLLQIEIANQMDKGARIFPCFEEAPRVFIAEIKPEVVQRWYNGNPYWDGDTKKLPIRISFLAKGQAASRTIWVKMTPHQLPGSADLDEGDFAWYLEGPCSDGRVSAQTFTARQSFRR